MQMDKSGNSILFQLNNLRLSDGTTAGYRLRAGTTPPSVAMPKKTFSGIGLTGSMGGTCIGVRPIDSLPASGSDDTAQIKESREAPPSLLEKKSISQLGVGKPTTIYESSEHLKDDRYNDGNYFRFDSDNNDNIVGSKVCKPNDIRRSKPGIMVPKPRSGAGTTSSSPRIENSNSESHEAISKDDVLDMQCLILNATSDFSSDNKEKDSSQGVAALFNTLKNKELQPLNPKRTSGAMNVEDDPLHPERDFYSPNQTDGELNRLSETQSSHIMASAFQHGFFSASGFSAIERSKALDANQFIVSAFGGGPIDNDRALKPVIRTLPELPEGGRYIVVGDVHGCVTQLEALVKKVEYTPGKDCLIIIGDYVNKGPYSIEVIRACQKWRALGVLGNHDYTLINCCKQMRRKPFNNHELRDPVKRLAMKFPLDCEFYLRSLPHILRMPKYNVVLVHAGFNIQCSLEEQNIYDIMHMRRLELVPKENGDPYLEGDALRYRAIIKGKGGVPWAEMWQGPELVIFGHDAFSGFQEKPLAYGIDTGCVYGCALTCVVLSEDHPKGEFFYVPGLTKDPNALKDMPPHVSPTYEKLEEGLDTNLIRPSRRSATSGTLCTPSYLSGSYNQSFPTAAIALPNSPPTNFHSRQFTTQSVSEGMIVNSAQKNPSEGIYRTHKNALLALSAAEELRALVVLMNLPDYEEIINTMLSNDRNNTEAQESFWVPFSRNILQASLLLTPRVDVGNDIEDSVEVVDIVQYVLSVCVDMTAVKAKVLPQLNALFAHANYVSKDDRKNHWKGIAKYIETMLT
ncbi:unnamed protein product [Phytomonas sp. Hart1]|nr:unnamed protein product [Phytomonas sp. Hart1]|eukprot:CCW66348.1 unnamed protein product [Phytomonas sp. isolate Hart1]